MGKALVYGVLGYTFSTTLESSDPANDLSSDGINYGIGVDYRITENVFLGAEYLGRRLDGDYGSVGFPGFTHETDSRTFSIRLGMTF
ncbi:MAG: hypothetical protein C0524_17305 [Rhodobacter sp.]|nr:hypothetical protein [Rhodobacter sp.]